MTVCEFPLDCGAAYTDTCCNHGRLLAIQHTLQKIQYSFAPSSVEEEYVIRAINNIEEVLNERT